MKDKAYEALQESWGFPSFARDFPRHEELDELLSAYVAGDYAAVGERAPKLASEAEDDAVKAAARTLLDRTRPDPSSRTLFLLTAGLLGLLTIWWVLHDGPPKDSPPAPTKPVPTVEFVN